MSKKLSVVATLWSTDVAILVMLGEYVMVIGIVLISKRTIFKASHVSDLDPSMIPDKFKDFEIKEYSDLEFVGHSD